MKIGDILYEFKAKPPVGKDPEVLTLTEHNGFVRQSDKFNKRLATEDISGYKFIERDDFAFNPYLLWAGALARNERFDAGVISPLYPTFRVKPGFDPAYTIRVLLADASIKRYDSIAFGSVPRRRRTSVKDFLSLDIPALPPLHEQRRMADILEKADILRSKRRETIAQLESLSESIFHEMFAELAGESTTLRDASLRFVSGRNLVGSGTQAHPTKRVLKVNAASRGTFDGSQVKPLPVNYEPPTEHKVEPGDLIVTRASGTKDLIGVATLVDAVPDETYLPDKLWKVIIDRQVIIPDFFRFLTRSSAYREYISTAASGATGVSNISQAKLLDFRLVLPPLETQELFSKQVSAIESLKTRHRAQLGEFDNLFRSLQDRAFKGEL